MATYRIFHWLRLDQPHPKAVAGPPPKERERQLWSIELTDAEVVALSSTFDVMLQGENVQNWGAKKTPVLETSPATIWLDDKGGRFRSRG